jgi:hypothetical protein
VTHGRPAPPGGRRRGPAPNGPRVCSGPDKDRNRHPQARLPARLDPAPGCRELSSGPQRKKASMPGTILPSRQKTHVTMIHNRPKLAIRHGDRRTLWPESSAGRQQGPAPPAGGEGPHRAVHECAGSGPTKDPNLRSALRTPRGRRCPLRSDSATKVCWI